MSSLQRLFLKLASASFDSLEMCFFHDDPCTGVKIVDMGVRLDGDRHSHLRVAALVQICSSARMTAFA